MKEKDLKETGLADLAYKAEADHETRWLVLNYTKLASTQLKCTKC